jgi:hypothetical protein
VKRTLLWLIVVAAILIIAFLLYRSHSATKLNIPPDAERGIEKAKRR